MNVVKKYLHNHYTSIMLAIITLSVAGSLIMLAFLSASLNQEVVKSNEQIKLLQGIAKEISEDQQKQHDHQDERAACFFNLFVSYTNTRTPITQKDADHCRVLSDGEEATVTPIAPQVPQTAQPTDPTPNTPPQAQNPVEPPKNENAQGTVETFLNDISQGLQNVVSGLIGRIL